MSIVQWLFAAFEYFVLLYFACLALSYGLIGYFGLRAVTVYSRELSPIALKDLLERDFYKPVSILVPAFNEEVTIVSSVTSTLALQHPQFEVIVASDGSSDRSLDLLIEAFGLVEVPLSYRRAVETRPVRRIFRSDRHPNLTVVDKENGGKADAINAALNVASYPLVCVVDADSVLDAQALLRASRLFLEDERIIGVGAGLRPLNGAAIEGGRAVNLRVPRRWVERIQILEYARAFFVYRAAWSRFDCLLIISGAFGLFRRSAVLEIGGWAQGFVADDMEIVVRLHRRFREMGRPYRLVYSPDPVCWTHVPATLKALRAQRAGWQRGMCEVLWRHRAMLLNPRYGRVGLVGIPYLWLFEAASAIIEAAGYIYIAATFALGTLNIPFAVMFGLLAVLYGVLLSQLGMGIETLLVARYARLRDRGVLLMAAFVEFAGFRQILVFARALAVFQVRSRHGRYWTQERPGVELQQ